jgi:hypothetical protein
MKKATPAERAKIRKLEREIKEIDDFFYYMDKDKDPGQ